MAKNPLIDNPKAPTWISEWLVKHSPLAQIQVTDKVKTAADMMATLMNFCIESAEITVGDRKPSKGSKKAAANENEGDFTDDNNENVPGDEDENENQGQNEGQNEDENQDEGDEDQGEGDNENQDQGDNENENQDQGDGDQDEGNEEEVPEDENEDEDAPKSKKGKASGGGLSFGNFASEKAIKTYVKEYSKEDYPKTKDIIADLRDSGYAVKKAKPTMDRSKVVQVAAQIFAAADAMDAASFKKLMAAADAADIEVEFGRVSSDAKKKAILASALIAHMADAAFGKIK